MTGFIKADTASSAPIRRPMHKIVAIFRRFIIRSFDSDARKAYTDSDRCTDKCVSMQRRNMPVSKKEVSACPIDAMLSVVDGRWKGTILWRLSDGPLRTSELRRSIPEITERMLIRHLQDLVRDGILIRHQEDTVPPRVRYSISTYGWTLD